mgnify:CR=1 FL=1
MSSGEATNEYFSITIVFLDFRNRKQHTVIRFENFALSIHYYSLWKITFYLYNTLNGIKNG